MISLIKYDFAFPCETSPSDILEVLLVVGLKINQMPLEDNAKRRFIAKKYLGRFLLLCRVCRHEGVFAIKSLIQDLYHTNKILFFQQNSQLSQNNGLGHGTTTIFLSYSHTGSTSKKLAFLADASSKAKTPRAVSGRSNLCNV